jgi:hypothetical protein
LAIYVDKTYNAERMTTNDIKILARALEKVLTKRIKAYSIH